MKRFWKQVTIEPGNGIALDGKPLRTPGRAPLTLPTPQLAEAVAGEWRAAGETIDPRAMPLTGLANAAIDRIAPDTAAFAAGLAAYGESDLLYYRAEGPRLWSRGRGPHGTRCSHGRADAMTCISRRPPA